MSRGLHEQIIGQMRLRAHRPIAPGVEFSEADLIERARPTQEGIASLAADVRATLFRDGLPEGHGTLAADFFSFAKQWIDFYKRLRSRETIEGAAAIIDEFDRRYRIAVQSYQQLGYRPSRLPPPSYQRVLQGELATIPPKKLPVARVLAVGAGVAGFWFLFRRRRRADAGDLEPIKIGPPQLAPPQPAPSASMTVAELAERLTERTGPAQTVR